MTTVVLRPDPQQFPAGTTVGAFPRSRWGPVLEGAPSGSAVQSVAVAAGGTLTYTTLTDGVEYVATAVVSSTRRYLRFMSAPEMLRDPTFVGGYADGEIPIWSDADQRFEPGANGGGSGGIPATLIDAKGDLIAGSAADTAARVAVGADGTVLTADAASAAGVKWDTPVRNVVDAKGDLLVGSADNTIIRKAAGADGTSLRANSAAAGGIEWLVTAENPLSHTNLVMPAAFPSLPLGGVVMTANRIFLCRFIMPRAGTLAGIAYWVVVSSGNYDVGVYDTGDALAGSRSRLYEKGATATPAAGWQELGTPALAVTRGQQIDVAFQVDNATASIGRQTFASSATGHLLPAGYGTSAGGATFKAAGIGGTPGALGLPSTIAEASITNVATGPMPAPVLRLT